jgi:hypothetical protein
MSTHPQIKSNIEERLVPGYEYTVISLRPIWAWAVMFAGKNVENRTLPTKQRGQVLIHASGQTMSMRENQELRAELSFLTGIALAELPITFERSAILGSVEIIDCMENARTKWAVPGQQHWVLHDPRPLPASIADIKGKEHFWQWTFEPGEHSSGSTRAPARDRLSSHTRLKRIP